MAEFNQLVASRYADGLRRLFGEDIKIGTIAPEILPYFAIDIDPPEWHVHKAQQDWIARIALGAVAAVFSIVGVIIPVAQKTLVSVVRKLIITNNTAAAVQYEVNFASGITTDAVFVPAGRDLRVARPPITQVFQRNQAAAPGSLVALVQVPATQSITIDIDIVLGLIKSAGADVGNAIAVFPTVINTPVDLTVIGYERSVRAEEIANL